MKTKGLAMKTECNAKETEALTKACECVAKTCEEKYISPEGLVTNTVVVAMDTKCLATDIERHATNSHVGATVTEGV